MPKFGEFFEFFPSNARGIHMCNFGMLSFNWKFFACSITKKKNKTVYQLRDLLSLSVGLSVRTYVRLWTSNLFETLIGHHMGSNTTWVNLLITFDLPAVDNFWYHMKIAHPASNCTQIWKKRRPTHPSTRTISLFVLKNILKTFETVD